MNEKPRPDSRLKILPDDKQAEIAEFAVTNTLADTVSWLQEQGIQTSPGALSTFLSWHRLKQQLSRNESTVETLLADLANRDSAVTAERLFETGHIFFSGSALEKQDARAWFMCQQIALSRARHRLDATKYHDLLEARKAAIKRELDSARKTGGISPETFEKIERELNLC
jgi:hypothetical protein